MGDRCPGSIAGARHFISVYNQPPRSTQPGHQFVGRRNDYKPKTVTLGSKGRYGSVCGWLVKLCEFDPIVTYGPYLSALETGYYTLLYFTGYFTLLYFTTNNKQSNKIKSKQLQHIQKHSKLDWNLDTRLVHNTVSMHHHCHHPLLLLTSTPDSKLIFSINIFLHSSSTFPPTGLTPRTLAVFRFSRACRF